MVNFPANSPPGPGTHSQQRRIALRHASIKADGSALTRTAEFTDGSTKTVTLKWNDITRVVAFQSVEPGAEQIYMIFTDPANAVVLDEKMEGFEPMVASLDAHLSGAPPAADWRASVIHPPSEVNFTRVFARKLD
jgi:hypothetical protein